MPRVVTVGVGEAGLQTRVEAVGRVAQTVEEGIAVGGLDEVNAAVREIGAAGDQPVSLLGVEVVGERGAQDPDLFDIAPVGSRLRLEREWGQPDRPRAAGGGRQRAVARVQRMSVVIKPFDIEVIDA